MLAATQIDRDGARGSRVSNGGGSCAERHDPRHCLPGYSLTFRHPMMEPSSVVGQVAQNAVTERSSSVTLRAPQIEHRP